MVEVLTANHVASIDIVWGAMQIHELLKSRPVDFLYSSTGSGPTDTIAQRFVFPTETDPAVAWAGIVAMARSCIAVADLS